MVIVLVRVTVIVDGYGCMICLLDPSTECVKVSHMIVECRVINHHPELPFGELANPTPLHIELFTLLCSCSGEKICVQDTFARATHSA